jgi:nucleoside phosphorylase
VRERTCVILASSRAVFVALRERLTGCVEAVHPGAGTVYEVGRLDETGGAFEVALVEVEPGAVTAAVETERALSHWTPGLMLSVGTALGLEGCGHVGDVMVATRVYGYEAGTDTPEGFRARPELGMADHRLEQQARAEARSGPWRTDDEPATEARPGVHLGPIAAGDKEIDDPGAALVEKLRWHCNDALAVERNGYAFHRAAHEHRMPAMVLRGVAQRLGEAGGDEALARRNVVNFALRLLARVVGSDEAHDRKRAYLERERAERGVDAWKAFFAEVMRVYELRRRRASSGERRTVTVRRGVGAFPRFALAVPEEDSRLGVELITTHSDTPSRAELETFVTESLAPRQTVDARAQATVVYAGAPPDDACREFARAASVRLESFAVFRGLIDFTAYLAKQRAELTVDRDRAYAPHLYVPQRMTWSIGRQPGVTEDALGEMVRRLRAPMGMFVLILGDFGTGKTFLMRQLVQRLHEDHGPVPMMVNLRLLNKSPKLDALLAAHWSQRDDEAIFDPKALHYMMEAGDVVLLFDGFDELALRVTYDRAAEHLATLVDAVKGKCRVVVTSRTQHFRNEDQSRTVLADTLDAANHQVFTLEKFDEGRIRRFLRNHLAHPRDGTAPPSDAALDDEVDRRYGLLRDIKDLGGLAETPRMLGMILEIPVEDLQAVKAREGTITAAELYERLLTRWLAYEWVRANPSGEARGLPLDARWRFVTRFARRLWRQTDPSLPLETLTEEAAAVVREMRLKIDPSVAAQEAGSGTLLCRDGEGRFSFVHQSVLEYLIAREAATELRASGAAEVLDEGELSTLMARFLVEQVGPEAAVRWAKAAPDTAGHARRNAVRVLTTVDAEFVEVFDFHGRDLREVDLSPYRTKLARSRGCHCAGSYCGRRRCGARCCATRIRVRLTSRGRISRGRTSPARSSRARRWRASARWAPYGRAHRSWARRWRSRVWSVRCGQAGRRSCPRCSRSWRWRERQCYLWPSAPSVACSRWWSASPSGSSTWRPTQCSACCTVMEVRCRALRSAPMGGGWPPGRTTTPRGCGT